MTNKKAKMFLFIGLIVFFISVVAVINFIMSEIILIKETYPNSPNIQRTDDFAILMVIFVFIQIPILFVELSFIRSTYKLLKYNPRGIVKGCYLVSSFLSLFACIWIVLIFIGIIDVGALDISIKIQDLMLFFPGFPTFIISFILGSLPVKKYKSDSIS